MNFNYTRTEVTTCLGCVKRANGKLDGWLWGWLRNLPQYSSCWMRLIGPMVPSTSSFSSDIWYMPTLGPEKGRWFERDIETVGGLWRWRITQTTSVRDFTFHTLVWSQISGHDRMEDELPRTTELLESQVALRCWPVSSVSCSSWPMRIQSFSSL